MNDLRQKIERHRNTIGSLERGEENVSLLAITALAKALRVKPAELIKTVRP
jgi:transcriptional regulator with XRE-family HTH domain